MRTRAKRGPFGLLHETTRDCRKAFGLFGVTSTDPLTYGGAAVFVVAAAAGASLIAARRASRVEPLVALRAHG